jgi:hypothetical protein
MPPEIQAFECDPVFIERNVPTDIAFHWRVIGAKKVEVHRSGQDEFGREEKRVHAADRPDDLDASDVWSNSYPPRAGQDRVVNHAWYWLRALGDEDDADGDDKWVTSRKVEVTDKFGANPAVRPRDEQPPGR